MDATRTNTALLAAAERRALLWLAERMPGRVNSDHLTGLALLSMLMVGVCYAVSSQAPLALVLAVFWLALNWFGDSLDGTLARVRNQQRPRYGFYVDHVCDSFGALFVLSGLALSGRMTPLVAAAVLIGYFLLSIEIYLATYCVGRFEMSHWGLGPTELRIMLAIGTLTLFVKPIVTFGGRQMPLFDVGGVTAAIGMTTITVTAVIRHVRALYAAEPKWPVSADQVPASGRGIPAGCVVPPSNTPGILGRRALPSGRRAPESSTRSAETSQPLMPRPPMKLLHNLADDVLCVAKEH